MDAETPLEVLVDDVQLQVKVSGAGGCVAGWGCIFSTGVSEFSDFGGK